jgi:GNAT superfamily N-acetyltransferase
MMLHGRTSMIEVIPATMAHARAIDLRPGDLAEIAAGGFTPMAALEASLARSLWADAYIVDGEVAALVGVHRSSIMGGETTAWLLTGKPVDRHAKAFLQITRARVAEMLARYGELRCNVHAEYGQAVAWLRWLGFDLGLPRPFGPLGAPFHEGVLLNRPGLVIEKSSVSAISEAPSFKRLAAEYASQSALADIPPPAARLANYLPLERSGALQTVVARVDGRVIGFITVLSVKLPHYAHSLSVSESFFVAKRHRSSGAGLRLLRAGEKIAAAAGSPGLLISAPFEGDLCRVLPRVGYAEVGRSFFKKGTS